MTGAAEAVSVPSVLPLGGGRVLLSDAAVVDAARAVNAVVTAGRRDHVPLAPRVATLARALNAEANTVLPRIRHNDVACTDEEPHSGSRIGDVAALEPPLTSKQVAVALKVSVRTAQRLARGSGARRAGRQWLMDAATVAELASERSEANGRTTTRGAGTNPVAVGTGTHRRSQQVQPAAVR